MALDGEIAADVEDKLPRLAAGPGNDTKILDSVTYLLVSIKNVYLRLWYIRPQKNDFLEKLKLP